MNVLVTGANGQLGSEIQKKVNLYTSLNFNFSDLQDLDITNLNDLKKYILKHNIRAIINCAAYTAVDLAETQVEKASLVNVAGPENLAKISEEYGIKLIHVSTDFVFDGNNNFPYNETDEPNPISVYGKTKYEGEQMVLQFCPSAMIIRTAWLYSAYGKNFVKTMLKLASEREELKVIFDQVGTPTWASDLADLILLLLCEIREGKDITGVFHYSNEGIASWYDFAFEIMSLSKLECNVVPIETSEYQTAAVRPSYCVLNKKKVKEELNLQIPHWKESLQKCIEEIIRIN